MERRVLNSPREGAPPSSATPAAELASRLQRAMLRLKGEHMAEDGRGVAYAALPSSPLFAEYVELAQELSGCDPAPLSLDARKAFFINVYNALTVHGLALAPPSSVLDLDRFWNRTCYCVAGLCLSLDDMEHGILRGNRPHPSATDPPFAEGDPREKFALPSCDPRIHFALVCGAKSCPAIQVYSGLNIDAALSSAACSFCAQEVVVEGGGEGVEGGGEVVEGGRVKMSKIFHWYADDFGSSQTERLRWISRYLPEAQRGRLEAMLDSGAPIQVELREYDWRLNKL